MVRSSKKNTLDPTFRLGFKIDFLPHFWSPMPRDVKRKGSV